MNTAPLLEVVDDAAVVLLGEGAHNIEEFLQVRNDLVSTLVTERGFTAVVMESGFAEGLTVDAYVQGGPGDATAIARQEISYRFGECAPAVEQLTWMRAHNASQRSSAARVRWYGMDLPGDSTSPEPALRACLSRIPPAPGDEELVRLATLGRRAQAAANWQSMSTSGRERLYDGIDDVARRVSHVTDPVARHCAEALLAFAAEARWTPEGHDGEAYPRDSFMADTVRWVLRRHERVLVCAHNGHVQRSPLDGRPMLGHLLATTLGDTMRVIGQTFGAGPEVHIRERSSRPFDWDVELRQRDLAPGSLESAIEGALGDSQDGSAFLVRSESGTGPVVPGLSGSFDAVVHHRRVRQVPGAFERLLEDVEDV